MDSENRTQSEPQVRSSEMVLRRMTSMVVSGEKLEGERLRGYVEGMSERDRIGILEDFVLLDMMNGKYGLAQNGQAHPTAAKTVVDGNENI